MAHIKSLRGLFRQASALMQTEFLNLLLFIAAYALLQHYALAPLGRAFWNGLSPFFSALSLPFLPKDAFLLIPAALILFVYALWALAGCCVVLRLLSCAAGGRAAGFKTLWQSAWSGLCRGLLPKNWLMALFALSVVLPVKFGFDSNFGLLIQAFVKHPMLYAAAAAIVYWQVEWLFALVYYSDGCTRKEAVSASRRLVRGHRGEGLAGIILFPALVILSFVLLFLAGFILYALVLMPFKALSLAGLTVETMILYPLYTFVMSAAALMAEGTIVTVFYRKRRGLAFSLPSFLNGVRRRFAGRFPLDCILAFTGAGLLCVALLPALARVDPYLSRTAAHRTQITGHRGYAAAAPENTLPAFEAAIQSGADYAELDVQQTKDGVVVITHDSDLKRCTGSAANVYDLNFNEVRRLNAAAGYTGPGDYESVQIPTLDEAIKLCDGKIKLNIEIKNPAHSPGLEEKTVAIIKDNDFEKQCVITSTNYPSLTKIKALDPDLICGYTISAGSDYDYDLPDADFLSINAAFITPYSVRAIHDRGKTICAWTVDSPEKVRQMQAFGVDNIITDDPDMARATAVTGPDPLLALPVEPVIVNLFKENLLLNV